MILSPFDLCTLMTNNSFPLQYRTTSEIGEKYFCPGFLARKKEVGVHERHEILPAFF